MSTAIQHSVLVDVVKLVIGAGVAAAQRRQLARQEDANAQAHARQAELAATLRQLELTAQQEKSQQQAAILSQIIDACKHVEDRKFDLILEAFRATHGLLAEQQKSLIEQRKDLARQLAEIDARKDVRKFAYLRKSTTEISNELEDIRRNAQLLQLQLQMFTREIGVNFRLPALPAV